MSYFVSYSQGVTAQKRGGGFFYGFALIAANYACIGLQLCSTSDFF